GPAGIGWGSTVPARAMARPVSGTSSRKLACRIPADGAGTKRGRPRLTAGVLLWLEAMIGGEASAGSAASIAWAGPSRTLTDRPRHFRQMLLIATSSRDRAPFLGPRGQAAWRRGHVRSGIVSFLDDRLSCF